VWKISVRHDRHQHGIRVRASASATGSTRPRSVNGQIPHLDAVQFSEHPEARLQRTGSAPAEMVFTNGGSEADNLLVGSAIPVRHACWLRLVPCAT
jgi:hypothetical protein